MGLDARIAVTVGLLGCGRVIGCSWSAGNALFLDAGADYISMFLLPSFIQPNTQCHLWLGPYGYFSYKFKVIIIIIMSSLGLSQACRGIALVNL